MEEIVRLHVKLLDKKTNNPLKGEEYTVRFNDKDVIEDDFLGESSIDDYGHAIVSVTRDDYRSKDSLLEKFPDIYFTVWKDGTTIYKSPVFKNINIEEARDFPVSEGLNYKLGIFRV